MGIGKVIDGSEVFIHDMVASDLNEAAGDEINYYSLNKDSSTIDPLYGEFIDRDIDGPWKLPALVAWDQQTPMTGEAGYTVEFNGKCTISRVHFEDFHAPYPIEGDIIEMWRTPYHDIDSMGLGLFFDVVQVNNDGHINDSPTFIQFILILKRRPQFGPERRIQKP